MNMIEKEILLDIEVTNRHGGKTVIRRHFIVNKDVPEYPEDDTNKELINWLTNSIAISSSILAKYYGSTPAAIVNSGSPTLKEMIRKIAGYVRDKLADTKN